MTANTQPPIGTADAARPARLGNQPRFAVKRPLWRKDDEHGHLDSTAFTATRESVFKRDNYACRYCGFKATKHQEIHHVDGDHHNHEATNLLTVCNLCHQVHHLGMSGARNAGVIAALPELTQVEVNHIARACFVAQRLGERDTGDRLTGLYALLQARSDGLKSAFNHDISSPLLLAELLASWDDERYAARDGALAALRLVPTEAAFCAGQLDYYAQNLKKPFSPDNWSALARQLAG